MSSWAIPGSKQQSEAQITVHLVAAELLDYSLDYFQTGSLLPRQCSADWLEWWPKALFRHTPSFGFSAIGKQTYSVLMQETTVASAIIGVFEGDKTGIRGTKKKCLLIVCNCFDISPVAACNSQMLYLYIETTCDFAQLWANHCSLNTCPFFVPFGFFWTQLTYSGLTLAYSERHG